MTSLLWIAPNLNHYKSKFLTRLTEVSDFDITVLAGAQMRSLGHGRNNEQEGFEKIEVKADKRSFQYSANVYFTLFKLILKRKFDTVLMPCEKKHIFVILFLFIMKYFFGYSFVTYTHHRIPLFKKFDFFFIEKIIAVFLFRLYDKAIFYTEEGMKWAIANNLIPDSKAGFANNTLDTAQIFSLYSFEVNKREPKTILFIGRLISNKKIELLFDYYKSLKKKIQDILLIIIGDGPESYKVKKEASFDKNILWRGVVVDERLIMPDMKKAHVVFVPGHSGLSIVHAFCYGKPYLTVDSTNHGPEISYLEDDINGLILTGKIARDSEKIIGLLTDDKKYEKFCNNAFATAKKLSVDNWCRQIITSLNKI